MTKTMELGYQEKVELSRALMTLYMSKHYTGRLCTKEEKETFQEYCKLDSLILDDAWEVALDESQVVQLLDAIDAQVRMLGKYNHPQAVSVLQGVREMLQS